MQAERLICVYCGAESFSGARYCRQCGKEFTDRQPASVTEGTTRLFDTPPQMASDPFSNLNDWAGPIDKPNTNPISIPTGKETQILSKPESKSNKGLIIGGIAAFAVVIAIVCALTLLFLPMSSTNIPTAPAQPEPQIVQQPPVPPVPQQPVNADLSKLIYPGAETVAKMRNGTMILSTGDSVVKVAKWYMGKLNPSTHITRPETQVLTTDEGISVTIARDDEGTKIILAQGENLP